MDNLVFTNIAIYKAIADEAHKEMVQLMEAGRRPKPDGSAGWIFTHDPNHTSFKQSLISIVFTGMWLEALLHLLIVKNTGKIHLENTIGGSHMKENYGCLAAQTKNSLIV